MEDSPKYLFRCDQHLEVTCMCDDCCSHPGKVVVSIYSHPVIKETEKGCWVSEFGSPVFKKWVSNTSKKRFAYPTKEQAIAAFKKRKERQISILKHQLKTAEEALALDPKNYRDCTQSFV